MAFRIAQISDTHLSAEKPLFVANFERIGEALLALRPDLVLNSGDISLSGKSKESDLSAGTGAARGDRPARTLPARQPRSEPDGRHDSRLVQVPGMPTLNIADFPEAYGPI